MNRENDPSALPPEDLQALLALPGHESATIDLLLPDSNGVLRGKRITADALEKVYAGGVCLPMSLVAADITGNTVEETGLGYDIGDEDRTCRPVPGSLRPVPWSPRPALQLLLAMEDGAGGWFEAHPRRVLQRVLDHYHALGLTPVVAVELEFYLFDRLPGADGRPQPTLNASDGRRNDSTQVYSIDDLDENAGFIDAVARACQAQRIPADTAVAEYAPGQFEINLRHRADALAACDDAILLKRATKAIAQQQGAQASFMAKPLAGQAGSGLHLHASVLDSDGRNLFAGTPDHPAAALRHAVGGLQRSARDNLLLFAPHANSYRRFVANAFVPLNDSWGFNNRTVAMRIPHSDAANTRIEHRIAGADANPYLVAAAVLAGMLDGIERRLDPGPPVRGNAYEQFPVRTPHWREAIDDFLGSGFAAGWYGEQFRHVYGQQKLREMRDFQALVPDLDYAWYLRTV